MFFHMKIFVAGQTGQRGSVDIKKLYSVYVGHLPKDITEVKFSYGLTKLLGVCCVCKVRITSLTFTQVWLTLLVNFRSVFGVLV